MQTSSFKLSVSLLFLVSLGSFGCGQTADAGPDAAPQGEAGADAKQWRSVKKPAEPALPESSTAGGNEGTAPAADLADEAGTAGAGGGLVDAQGDASDDMPKPDGDRVPPRIVSVTPANGAIGVKADSPIVITFSEPMARRETLDAFASTTLPRAQSSMTWDETGAKLTIRPNTPLGYAHTTVDDGESLELDAKQYGYTLTRFATDLAGNPLEETSVTFSTLREVTQTYAPVPELTGVLPGSDGDARFYGLVTFDADQFPAGIVNLERAVAHFDPYVLGAPLPIYHLRFDELTSAATRAPGSLLETVPAGTTGNQPLPEALVELLAPDYTERSPAYHYSQYRLVLPAGLSEASVLAVNKFLADASIEAEYLLP